MKVIISLVLCACAVGAFALTQNREAIVGFTLSGTNPQSVHDSANSFATDVGNKLKEMYPARVAEVSVGPSVFLMKDKTTLVHMFAWRAKIVSCPAEKADYYFDRRGTYLGGADKLSLESATQKETGKKVSELEKSFTSLYGKPRKAGKSTKTMKNPQGGFWVLEEVFIAAPKK